MFLPLCVFSIFRPCLKCQLPVFRFKICLNFWGEDTVPNCRSHDSEFAPLGDPKLSGLLAGRRMDLLLTILGRTHAAVGSYRIWPSRNSANEEGGVSRLARNGRRTIKRQVMAC